MKTRRIALLALAATLGACSEAVAPGSRAPDTQPLVGGVTTDLSMTDTTRFSITIDPWRPTTFNLGAGNTLNFPAGSVCDPNTSTYGATEWDVACNAARYAVTVNVRAWLNAKGHPRVDFTPNIRFVPSLLPTGWVNITFADMAASLDPWYNILYCPTVNGACLNEASTDASLLTVRDPVTGKVTRRLKHFSGYLVGAGGDSSSFNRIGVAPEAKPLDSRIGRSHHGRSGYILVSGRR